MTEAHELAEKISEAAHHFDHTHMSDDAFRRRVGVLIGLVACALAITSVFETKAMKETINANIETSDDYAYYQAKVLRQQIMESTAAEIELILQTSPGLPAAEALVMNQRLEGYKKSIAKLESSPETGTGQKELLAKAALAEHRRAESGERDEWFELGEAMLQIAVVVASTAVLMASRRLLVLALTAAAIGTLSTFFGYLGLFAVPFSS